MELWYTEEQTENMRLSLKIKETLFSEKSRYQEINIVDTYTYGRMLTLDGLVMTTEKDEFVYHEALGHSALVMHPNPKNILIIGGGDGGTLREVVKHPEIEKAYLVEIDGEVVESCKKYLPSHHGGWEHPKSEVIIMDGFEFLKRNTDTFDVILVDGTDPIGPGEILFAEPFYKLVLNALRPNGLLLQQCESFWVHPDIIGQVAQTMHQHFQRVDFFTAPIPTYPSGYWNFAFCQKDKSRPPQDMVIAEKFSSLGELRYLNPELLKASFALPNFAKKALGIM